MSDEAFKIKAAQFASQFVGGNMGIKTGENSSFRGVVESVTFTGEFSGRKAIFEVVLHRPAYNARKTLRCCTFRSWQPGAGQYVPAQVELA